ncbi:Armadillo/beta-catenin-like repeat [Carpediemonas membranifera]|uniref:Armadillo/beta-catenin-like repeat n=1 Tax=Carpediemonas membranifera TaxID=201153 RepID=A0A8J6E6F8_9EUKA|nr:Armadillo/beta-catenin-like repeat [Carpediemonas membranifera]|eukprot:KAG9397057.1 Armadillo/beta-catenin-like repeat [Carpediemonas membranifera]
METVSHQYEPLLDDGIKGFDELSENINDPENLLRQYRVKSMEVILYMQVVRDKIRTIGVQKNILTQMEEEERRRQEDLQAAVAELESIAAARAEEGARADLIVSTLRAQVKDLESRNDVLMQAVDKARDHTARIRSRAARQSIALRQTVVENATAVCRLQTQLATTAQQYQDRLSAASDKIAVLEQELADKTQEKLVRSDDATDLMAVHSVISRWRPAVLGDDAKPGKAGVGADVERMLEALVDRIETLEAETDVLRTELDEAHQKVHRGALQGVLRGMSPGRSRKPKPKMVAPAPAMPDSPDQPAQRDTSAAGLLEKPLALLRGSPDPSQYADLWGSCIAAVAEVVKARGPECASAAAELGGAPVLSAALTVPTLAPAALEVLGTVCDDPRFARAFADLGSEAVDGLVALGEAHDTGPAALEALAMLASELPVRQAVMTHVGRVVSICTRPGPNPAATPGLELLRVLAGDKTAREAVTQHLPAVVPHLAVHEGMTAEDVTRVTVATRLLSLLLTVTDARVAIRKQGGIGPLVECLTIDDNEVTRHAIGALINVSLNIRNKDEVRKVGGLEALLDAVRVPDVEIKRLAARALCNLAINSDNCALLHARDAAELFTPLLSTPDHTLHRYALRFMTALFTGDLGLPVPGMVLDAAWRALTRADSPDETVSEAAKSYTACLLQVLDAPKVDLAKLPLDLEDLPASPYARLLETARMFTAFFGRRAHVPTPSSMVCRVDRGFTVPPELVPPATDYPVVAGLVEAQVRLAAQGTVTASLQPLLLLASLLGRIPAFRAGLVDSCPDIPALVLRAAADMVDAVIRSLLDGQFKLTGTLSILVDALACITTFTSSADSRDAVLGAEGAAEAIVALLSHVARFTQTQVDLTRRVMMSPEDNDRMRATLAVGSALAATVTELAATATSMRNAFRLVQAGALDPLRRMLHTVPTPPDVDDPVKRLVSYAGSTLQPPPETVATVRGALQVLLPLSRIKEGWADLGTPEYMGLVLNALLLDDITVVLLVIRIAETAPARQLAALLASSANSHILVKILFYAGPAVLPESTVIKNFTGARDAELRRVCGSLVRSLSRERVFIKAVAASVSAVGSFHAFQQRAQDHPESRHPDPDAEPRRSRPSSIPRNRAGSVQSVQSMERAGSEATLGSYSSQYRRKGSPYRIRRQ